MARWMGWVLIVATVLLTPLTTEGEPADTGCSNPCGPTCASGSYLGATCGDQGATGLTLSGCGGGWLRCAVTECSANVIDLSFVAILSAPDDGTTYELRVLQDCSLAVGADTDPDRLRKRVYHEWGDSWGLADDRDFGIEIRLVSGTPRDDWHLEIRGNATPLSAAPFDLSASRALRPNIPNPFNPDTEIRFELPSAGPTRLTVLDVAGRLIRTLIDDGMPQGNHAAVWDGRDGSGRQVGSGTYLARLEFGGKVETVRMGLVR